jgi:hypothetical protein
VTASLQGDDLLACLIQEFLNLQMKVYIRVWDLPEDEREARREAGTSHRQRRWSNRRQDTMPPKPQKQEANVT